jgi:biotin carboxyl carrier protein
MDYTFSHSDTAHTVTLKRENDHYNILLNNKSEYKVTDVILQPNVISFTLNDNHYHVYIATDKEKTYLSVNGENFIFESERHKTAKTKAGAKQKGNTVFSPMPGLLVNVPVSVGDQVTAGTILAVVEAMKMQNELESPRDGIVKTIHAQEGDQVDALQVIVELE